MVILGILINGFSLITDSDLSDLSIESIVEGDLIIDGANSLLIFFILRWWLSVSLRSLLSGLIWLRFSGLNHLVMNMI